MPLPPPDREMSGPASGQSRLSLPQVTLVAISSVTVSATARAVAIARLTSHFVYSHFVLKELSHFIATSHMLFVQWDGYVLHPDCGRDSFLDYDYIGAPWPQFEPPWNLTEDVAIARDCRGYGEDAWHPRRNGRPRP